MRVDGCRAGDRALRAGVLYNCRVLLLNSRVLLVRPKLSLANDGNYREARYFSTWKQRGVVEDLVLPPCVAEAARALPQATAPFGDGVLRLRDTSLAGEPWAMGKQGSGGGGVLPCSWCRALARQAVRAGCGGCAGR